MGGIVLNRKHNSGYHSSSTSPQSSSSSYTPSHSTAITSSQSPAPMHNSNPGLVGQLIQKCDVCYQHSLPMNPSEELLVCHNCSARGKKTMFIFPKM